MSKPRTVKLFSPSLSKLVQLVAWDEQRLDVGSIARAFGLHPSTVKLNGHFISRGVDLVSTSVTWRSLLKFFSAKGLSTGKDDQDALIVDGKLCKLGSKRSHDSQDAVDKEISSSHKPPSEEINSLKNKKLRDGSSGGDHNHNASIPISNGIGFKRKQLLEDVGLLKKLKINESSSDFPGKGADCSSTTSITQLKCSYLSENVKRPREHEVIVATPCKRIR
ncbi:hypothetical protein Pint_01536 [Pistacia integerrima]|uniref:Uncharacterized protein n=1 Tax=Pistacia integerrima TaxID=434235 RepID=A0ACC0ZJJ5_9ROSI|nr:hypothetical protein Pint_01536 [Pistacia integerrima]